MVIAGLAPSARTSLHFLKRDDLYLHEKPYSIQYYPHGDIPRSNVVQFVAPDVPIFDMRPVLAELDFDRHGFVVQDLNSHLTRDEFSNPDRVKGVYLEEVKQMLCKLLHTKNVAMVEYLLLVDQMLIETVEDFSPDCLVDMIHDRYAHRAEALLKHRYRIVNVWKPLQGPLRDWPLLLCKPSSIDPSNDLQLMDRVYPTNVEESIQVHYNEAQEWYFLSDQMDTEVLVFRGGDSAVGLESGVPHCSFDASELYPDAVLPRESIEVRALVFDADEDLDLQSVSMSRRHGPKATYQQQPRPDLDD